MEFIRVHQLSIMLLLIGVSAILSLVILVPRSLSRKRKSILELMALSSMILLVFERYAYIFRGNTEKLGYYMVRVSNGIVFFMLLFIPFIVTQYLKDLLLNEGKLTSVPALLRVCDALFLIGAVLLVVSQFTGLYYSFDAQNVYHRAPTMVISYVPPMVMVLLQEISVVRNRAGLSRGLFVSLLFSIVLPTIASIVQLFFYGVSLTCMSLVFVVIIFFVFVLVDMNKEAEAARKREIEFYRESQRIEAAMFEQTVEALASAIDAKDIYTHGHSARVASYSRQIAEKAGLPAADCEKTYFAALLHDVGKIGVPNEIINKEGELTPEEFAQIKLHTTVGEQILQNIKQSPSLRIGALYHHERYDGTGYPEGLSGEDIPEIARIIAVADAYDAMTSTRSYRSSLSDDEVRRELKDGSGTQFDPRFAAVMLDIMDGENAPRG